MENSTMKLAAIQMHSGDVLDDNLQLAAQLTRQAADRGATLTVLPEYFYLMGESDSDRIPLGEAFGDGPIQAFLADLARETGMWLQSGTVPLIGPDSKHIYNSCLTFNPAGECVCRYDKIYLFAFEDATESYLEADTLAPGNEVKTVETPLGLLRPAVCYDLRFPELFRTRPEPDVIGLPAAFAQTTGEAHWEILLRARAIENQCYVAAAGQTGTQINGRQTFGHTMVIDPWGRVLDVCQSGNGVAIATFDPLLMQETRRKLPALKNRLLNP